MLSELQIKNLSIKMQTSVINVAREYVQNLFLSYFYAAEESEKIFFKGGTALRLLYRSPRFSEDLDFSTPAIHPKLIDDILQEALVKLDYDGIKADVLESTPTTGGYLSIISSQVGSCKFNLSVQISSRKKKMSGQLVAVDNPYINPYTVMSLKREEMIAEKVEALLNRRKPRDFFDLYFMLRANLLPEKGVLRNILPLVEKTNINFKRELGEFLPYDHQRIIKDFKSILASEIKRFIT